MLFSFVIIIFVVVCIYGDMVLIFKYGYKIYKAYCLYLEIKQLVGMLIQIQMQILCETQIPASKYN